MDVSAERPIIAGMWGTTHLSVFLMGAGETQMRRGPGVARVRDGDFQGALLALVGDWLDAHASAPVILAGMIGSTMGWRDAGYTECPARAEEAARRGVDVELPDRAARIVRGLACVNVLGEPDVLRGEETEALGWAALTPGADTGAHLLCVPGTHAKWIIVRDGVVTSFLSSVAGELFAALHAEGVLTDRASEVYEPRIFADGVRDAAADGASLPHLLFAVRARVARGLLEPAHAVSRLSGLIVGADAIGAKRALGEAMTAADSVVVIGMPEIGARYAEALGLLGVETRRLDSREAAMAGLRRAAVLAFESEASA